MAITRISHHQPGLPELDAASDAAPAEADISWFNAAMRSNPAPAQNDPQRMISPLSEASLAYQKDPEKVDRNLQRAARSNDPQTLIEANRSLSSFYLESLLSAKLVSKAAQTVEKLTSLQ